MFAAVAIVLLTVLTGNRSYSTNVQQLEAWLGERVEIPCTAQQHHSTQDSVRWYYRNSSSAKDTRILHREKSGLVHYNNFPAEKKILSGFKLIINNFKEEDQGIYSCEIFKRRGFSRQPGTRLVMLKDTHSAITKRLYATEGEVFTHPCVGGLGNWTPVVTWTFQQFGEASSSPLSDLATGVGRLRERGVLPNASIHIRDVLSTDAGNYSCRDSNSPARQQIRMSLSLCVLTVTSNGSSEQASPGLNCSLWCDEDWEPAKPPPAYGNFTGPGAVVVETDTVTFFVSDSPDKRKRTVACRMKERVGGGVMVKLENATLAPENDTFQEDTQPSPHTLPLFMVLPVSTSVLVLTLCFILLCRHRKTAESHGEELSPEPSEQTNKELGEAECQIVYSTLELRKPEQDRPIGQEEGCVYSVIGQEEGCVYSVIRPPSAFLNL
ncbi:hypothetical protein AGOR_G00120460 [Albula goreensis]|uniref:Ig-like domain-containing protein n=1 Tax=Albula goreensis TaxID=1534307 RepID=A0A8T3DGG3_9TELE|nr:hypothetical protein AGOR_G00120460 [Albula goreensis]